MKRTVLIAGAGVSLVLATSSPLVRSALRDGSAARPAITPPVAAEPSGAHPEAVTVAGTLTLGAREAITRESEGARTLLIVARAGDTRVCEDLGRQLRETLRDARGRFRPVLVTEDSAVDEYRAFAKREHLQVQVVPFGLDSLLAGRIRLPTPAVLVDVAGNGRVEGVAYPDRVANVRTRSFAAEMHRLLATGSTDN